LAQEACILSRFGAEDALGDMKPLASAVVRPRAPAKGRFSLRCHEVFFRSQSRWTMKLLQRLWADETAFVVTTELVLVATILVIGTVVGLATVRDAVVAELADVAAAIGSINQSYSWSGISGHSGLAGFGAAPAARALFFPVIPQSSAATAGSQFQDSTDFCDGGDDVSGSAPQCVVVHGPGDGGE
jgi:hypothetical protein